MMGAVTCKCDKNYAGTSQVQYKEVVRGYAHHAPNPYHSLRSPPYKDDFKTRRFPKFASAIAPAQQGRFKGLWQRQQAVAIESKEGLTDEMAYPPGVCAAQLMVLLAIGHSCRPIGLTERWYSSKGSMPSKLKVRDLGPDGVPSAPRMATESELRGDSPIPPCETCQIILQALMCPDDKGLECSHKKPTKKVCARC